MTNINSMPFGEALIVFLSKMGHSSCESLNPFISFRVGAPAELLCATGCAFVWVAIVTCGQVRRRRVRSFLENLRLMSTRECTEKMADDQAKKQKTALRSSSALD